MLGGCAKVVQWRRGKRRWSPSGVPLGKEGGYQPDTDMKDLLDVEDTSDPQDVPTRRRSTNPIK